jgi:hypothetical protein
MAAKKKSSGTQIPKLKPKEHKYFETARSDKGRAPLVRPKDGQQVVPEYPGASKAVAYRATHKLCERSKLGDDCIRVPSVKVDLDKAHFRYTTPSTVTKKPQTKAQKKRGSAAKQSRCERLNKTKRYTGLRCVGDGRNEDGTCKTYSNRKGKKTAAKEKGGWTNDLPWKFNTCSSNSDPCTQKRTGCVAQLVYRGGRPHLRFCGDKKGEPGRIVPVGSYQEAAAVAKEGCATFAPKTTKTAAGKTKKVKRHGYTKAEMKRTKVKGKALSEYRLGGVKSCPNGKITRGPKKGQCRVAPVRSSGSKARKAR